MTAKLRDPLLVNMAWTGVALLGFLAVHLSSFCGTAVLMGRGSTPLNTGHRLQQTVFRPLIWYAEQDLPGGQACTRLASECYAASGGGSEGHERWED
jgi:hypothetical protein